MCLTTAGLAASAVAQGQWDQARSSIHEAWNYLKKHDWHWVDLEHPPLVYRICAETLDALGEEETLQELLEIGQQELVKEADKITAPAWRQSFLENNPDSRAFLAMWERRKRQ